MPDDIQPRPKKPMDYHSRGGLNRAANMAPEARVALARMAAIKRWSMDGRRTRALQHLDQVITFAEGYEDGFPFIPNLKEMRAWVETLDY